MDARVWKELKFLLLLLIGSEEIMKTSKETEKNLVGFLLSFVGGLVIAISGFSRGFYAYRYAIGIFILVFGTIPALLLGMVVLILTLARKRIATIIFSLTSLVYLPLVYQSFIYSDGDVLPLLLVIVGSICSILGNTMTKKRTSAPAFL
jgi:hypothetical protein